MSPITAWSIFLIFSALIVNPMIGKWSVPIVWKKDKILGFLTGCAFCNNSVAMFNHGLEYLR